MTARDRRALVVGGGVLLVALLVLRVIPAGLAAYRDLAARHDAERRLVDRLRREVGSAPALEDSVAAMRRRFLALAPRIVRGGTEVEAIADLTAQVHVLAQRHRVRVARADAVPDSLRAGLLRRITLRVAWEGDTRGSVGLVHGVERSALALELADLRVSAPDPRAPEQGVETLRGEALVSGWYLTGARLDSAGVTP